MISLTHDARRQPVEFLSARVQCVVWNKTIDTRRRIQEASCGILSHACTTFCVFFPAFPSSISLRQQDDTAADRKDIALLQKTLMKLARRLGYRVLMSLANYKYAGTAVLIRYGNPSDAPDGGGVCVCA